jgi:hypothetical protein
LPPQPPLMAMTSKARNTVNEDRIHREGVLMFLLHETELATIDEVVVHRQALVPGHRHAEIRDGTERAVTELAAAGVVNVEGRSVYASGAAREVHRLVEGVELESRDA